MPTGDTGRVIWGRGLPGVEGRGVESRSSDRTLGRGQGRQRAAAMSDGKEVSGLSVHYTILSGRLSVLVAQPDITEFIRYHTL